MQFTIKCGSYSSYSYLHVVVVHDLLFYHL